jgi:hypothetical protein
MAIFVERDEFDVDNGFQYYLSFKPGFPGSERREDVCASVAVEALLCVSETGALADCRFVLPKPCRSEQALTFIRRQQEAHINPPQVHIAVPGAAGDAIANAIGSLELDVAGRIVGMVIRWMPEISAS